jgi:hypothetical protein
MSQTKEQSNLASSGQVQEAAVRAKLVEAARLQNEREAKLAQLLGSGDPRGLRLIGGSVSKATFMDAVQENIDTFGNSKEQAIQEAVKEFGLMGVDVSALAKDLTNELI